MEKRFVVLRVIVWVLRILGVLAIVVGIIGGITGLITGFRPLGMMRPFGSYQGMRNFMGGWYLLSGLVSGIILYGVGEVIELLLAIEENTRAARALPSAKE